MSDKVSGFSETNMMQA